MKNIIFDLGGVILKGTPLSVLDKFNLNSNDYEELKRFFIDWKNIDLGIESLENKFNSCNYSNYIISNYKNILINYYKLRDINFELIELIKKLKNNNYNVYILSDNNKESDLYYRELELFNNIDGWILSCNYQKLKKDGLLFEILLNKYNLNPSECYFIDNTKENILIAYKYGIKGYLFNENDDINNLYNDMLNNEIKLSKKR